MAFPKSVKRFQNALAYRALLAVQWVISRLPYFLVNFFTKGLLSFVYLFMIKMRRIITRNLQTAFGSQKTPAKLEEMTKGCLKNVGQSMIDMLYFVDRPHKVKRKVKIEGQKYLDDSLALNRGVIAVTAHLGNFPIMFMKLVQQGFKINVIIRQMRDLSFEKFMFRQTDKWGINMIRTTPKKKFLKETIRSLKNNGLLFILLDETSKDNNGVTVDFLNNKTSIATGPMLFYERFHSPVHFIYTVKEPDGYFKVVITPALKVTEGSDEQSNTLANISALVKGMEEVILQYPSQWGGWLNKH